MSAQDRQDQINTLSKGKQRFSGKFGLTSAWRLTNGWIAVRRAPDSGWRDHAYWQLFKSEADLLARKMFAGADRTLVAALDIALRVEAGEFQTQAGGAS